MFLPLAFITFQVLMLRRDLQSAAWNLIAAGFVVFAGLSAYFGLQVPPERLVGALIGYGLIALGFHLLHRDLDRVLRRR